MYLPTMQPLTKEDTWHLLSMTGDKIRQAVQHKDHDLHRLAILCNTFDQNLLRYGAMEAQLEEDVAFGETLSATECCSPSDATAESKESDIDVDVPEPHDTDSSTDSDSDSDEWADPDSDSDEWDSAEVIDGVLPPVDGPKLHWLLSTYGAFFPLRLSPNFTCRC